MRQTIAEIETNIACSWLFDYGLNDKIPHFIILGNNYIKSYVRTLKDTDIFEKIFIHILKEAQNAGFVDANPVFIDSTHVKLDANKNKYNKVKLKKEAHGYQKLLEKEINKDR